MEETPIVGEPVYLYSLKEGINDGFLTPFKAKQIYTALDEYVYRPGDRVMEGEIEAGRRYEESDFNKIIEIKEREAHRVKIFMDQIDQGEKALVFCASQDHALAVRDLVNQMKTSTGPNYCQRVTANDGELGEPHLRDFQDNEEDDPDHPDHVAEALDRCGRTQDPQHRLDTQAVRRARPRRVEKNNPLVNNTLAATSCCVIKSYQWTIPATFATI